MDWQFHSMPYTTVTTDLDKALNIGLNFPSQFTFYLVVLIYDVAKLSNLFLSEILDPGTRIYPSNSQNFSAQAGSYAIDILQSYPDRFVLR